MKKLENYHSPLDPLTHSQRSERMRAVKSRDTKPEVAVRKLVWGMGFRYRLYRKDLPGCPDLVFPGKKKVIFVNGCFWHRHEGCPLCRIPKSRQDYWQEKFNANQRRDSDHYKKLKDEGWDILIVWECQIKDRDKLRATIDSFLVKGS